MKFFTALLIGLIQVALLVSCVSCITKSKHREVFFGFKLNVLYLQVLTLPIPGIFSQPEPYPSEFVTDDDCV